MKLNQIIYFSITILLSALFSCNQNSENINNSAKSEKKENTYKIAPVPIKDVKLTDNFWLPIVKRVQEKTIQYAINKCSQEGRFDNFLIAGGKMEGTVKGAMPFDDTDVYKIIEGASNSLLSAPNPELQTLIDSLIKIVKIGQEADGYLTTWRTINPAKPSAPWVEVKEGKRWESLFMSHELYNAGHLYEAAAVHFKATGKRNFLDIALKNADLMVKTFGDNSTKIQAVPGHQIIESGLIKLYQITKKKEYLELAKYFLDNRGNPKNHKLFGSYSQDHKPVIEQTEVVGHAVRAVYMYAAMTDIAAILKDSAYKQAVFNLWENMVNKKIYITGGIGARHDGEAFGENYELPNLTAYNETCAAIGSVYWNHRLFLLTGKSVFYDVLERTLYNGLISGLSLDGTQFFYPNALESDGKYKSNRGSCTRQDWFDCSCCPTNIIRFIPSLPGLIYSQAGDSLWVNLYASNSAKINLNNSEFTISQETEYPWNGRVKLKIEGENMGKFKLNLRIPAWAQNKVLNGVLYSYSNENEKNIKLLVNNEVAFAEIKDSYISIEKEWKNGDEIRLELPMKVRTVEADEKIEDNRNKLSIEYGPIVYAIEEVDNKNNFDNITINSKTKFKVEWNPELLGGINSIQSENMQAIPYFVWSNRGVNKMKVWIPVK